MKICFIGHRKIGCGQIRERLNQTIQNEIKNGGDFFTMGTHGEFDEMALECLRDVRKNYPNIIIEVVLTSLHKAQKKLFDGYQFGKEYYLQYRDVQTTIYEIEDEYFKRQIIVSNKKMIDECDVLICYVNVKNNPSGAKLVMNYAKRKGLKIINLYRETDDPVYGMSEEQKQEYFKNLHEQLNEFLKK